MNKVKSIIEQKYSSYFKYVEEENKILCQNIGDMNSTCMRQLINLISDLEEHNIGCSFNLNKILIEPTPNNLEEFIRNDEHYIEVTLDEHAIIVYFKCTLKNINIDFDVIGKNWFDVFIKDVNKEEIMHVFKNLLTDQIDITTTYKNSILMDNQHQLIDFKNVIFLKDNKKFIYSYGVKHNE